MFGSLKLFGIIYLILFFGNVRIGVIVVRCFWIGLLVWLNMISGNWLLCFVVLKYMMVCLFFVNCMMRDVMLFVRLVLVLKFLVLNWGI